MSTGGHNPDDARSRIAARAPTLPRASAHLVPATPMPANDPMSNVQVSEEGQLFADTHEGSADLAHLHMLMGHFARMYWDLQKVRIAMNNRVSALERDRAAYPAREHTEVSFAALETVEADLKRKLERLARQHPMALWIRQAKGIGLPSLSALLGITGPLDQFPTVSKLWKYLGMHVVDGHAPKREKGVRLNYSPQGRVLCHQIGDAIVKVGAGGPYREAYDTKKAEYLARERTGPSSCPFGHVHKDRNGKIITCGDMHAHVAAMRYAVKMLLKDLWCEWRKVVPTCGPTTS